MNFRPHISLEVADLEAAVQFYRLVFDQEPTKRYSDYANFRLESPPLHLALVHAPERSAVRPGNEHFGIELFDRDALHGWQQRLVAAGLPLRIEQQVTCCYAVGDKFWITDPDAHEWEFWVRSEEADAMHGPTQQIGQPAQCCVPAAPPLAESLAECCPATPTAARCCG